MYSCVHTCVYLYVYAHVYMCAYVYMPSLVDMYAYDTYLLSDFELTLINQLSIHSN